MANTLNNEQGVVNAIHKLVEQQRAQRKQTERFQQALRSSFTDTMRQSMQKLLEDRAFNEDARYQKQRDIIRAFAEKEQKAQNRIDKMQDRGGFDSVSLMDVLNPKKWREATDQFRSEHNNSIAGKLMRSYRARTGALSVDTKVALKAHKASAYGELEDAIRDSMAVLAPPQPQKQEEQQQSTSQGTGISGSSDTSANKNSSDVSKVVKTSEATNKIISQEIKEQKQLTVEQANTLTTISQDLKQGLVTPSQVVEQTNTLTEISQVLKQGLTTQPQTTEKIADNVASINKQIVNFLQPAAGKNQQYSVEDRVEAKQTERTKVDMIKSMSNDIHTILTVTTNESKGGNKKGGLVSGIMGALGGGLSFLPKLIGMGLVGLMTAVLTDLKKMKLAVDIASKAIPILLTMLKPIGDAVSKAVEKVLAKIPGLDDLFEHKPDAKAKAKIGDKPNPKTDPKKAPGTLSSKASGDNKPVKPADPDVKLNPKNADPLDAIRAENRAAIDAKGVKTEILKDAPNSIRVAKPLMKLGGAFGAVMELGSAVFAGKERFDDIDAVAAREGWTEEQINEAKAKAVGETTSEAAMGAGGAATGAIIGGMVGALGGPLGVALGSWFGGMVGSAVAEKVKTTDVGKGISQAVGDAFNSGYKLFGDNEVQPVKQDQQGSRMQSKASQQEKAGQTVVNVNTQNNNNNTAVNGGATPPPPITAVDDLDGVRRYSYSGSFIGTD